MSNKIQWWRTQDGDSDSKCGRFAIALDTKAGSGFVLVDCLLGGRYTGETTRVLKRKAQELQQGKTQS